MLTKLAPYKLIIIFVSLIFGLYFLLRLPNLTSQPIFADEAIYIRWAQVMRAEPTLRFLPLSDGKTPLFMWAMIPLLKIFNDPLLAGRLLSVFSGFLTLIGVLFAGWRFFNKWVGVWSALLVAIIPYMVFFDRMALVDSMLTAFVVWTLVLAMVLIKNPRYDLAMCLGYLLGTAMLTKTTAVFSFVSLPATLLTFEWFKANKNSRLFKIFILWLIALIISMAVYNVLRLGPGFSNLSSRNQDYVHPASRLAQYPFDPFLPHVGDLIEWLPKFLTMPVLFMFLGGLGIVIYKRDKNGVVVLIWILIPLIIQLFLLKTFTTRYILPSMVISSLFGGICLETVLNKYKKRPHLWFAGIGISCLLLTPALVSDIQIVYKPESAVLPQETRRGYLEDWTAGYGLKEIANFLIEESKTKHIVVGTEGYFGTLPDGLYIYLDKEKNISVVGGGPLVSPQLIESTRKHPTYFVANKSRVAENTPGLELLKSYPKITGSNLPQDAILLFRVIPVAAK